MSCFSPLLVRTLGETLNSNDLDTDTVLAAGWVWLPGLKFLQKKKQTLQAFLTPYFLRLSSCSVDPGSANAASDGIDAHRVSGFQGWKKLRNVIIFGSWNFSGLFKKKSKVMKMSCFFTPDMCDYALCFWQNKKLRSGISNWKMRRRYNKSIPLVVLEQVFTSSRGSHPDLWPPSEGTLEDYRKDKSHFKVL